MSRSPNQILIQPIGDVAVDGAGDRDESVKPLSSVLSGWRWYHGAWLLVLFFVGFLAVLVSGRFDDSMRQMFPEALPMPSTYNKRQSGYSAMYQLCQRVGLPVNRWEQSYRNLKDNHVRGTLVIIDPSETPSEEDCQRITDWVGAGNDLVYLDYFGYGTGRRLIDKLGAEVHGGIRVQHETVEVDTTTAESKFVPTVVVSADAFLDGGTSIARSKRGTILMNLKNQQGNCFIGTDPQFCANEHIADAKYKGNFQILVNRLQLCRAPILFDERCHGYSAGSGVFFFLLKRYFGGVFFQTLLIALVAFLSLNQRFGRKQSVPVVRNISNLEYIDGLAATYRRAHARDTVWEMIFHPFKSRLCKALGVSPQDDSEQIARAWVSACGGDVGEYSRFLNKAQEATQKRSLSEPELQELVASCDRLGRHAKGLVAMKKISGA